MADQNPTISPDDVQERWLPVPDFPGYEVSDLGRLRSFWRRDGKKGKGGGAGAKAVLTDSPQSIHKPGLNHNGYLQVSLRKNGKPYSRRIHRLVLLTFRGPCPPGMESRHLDGIQTRNYLTNLVWGTKKENGADKISHGNSPAGEKNNSATLSETQVIQIRSLYAQGGYSYLGLSRLFNVHKTTIAYIIRRQTWRHIL